MTREELLAALDIAPEAIDDAGGPDDDTPRAPAAPPSRHALVLDEWSKRKGAEALRGDVLGPILGDPTQPQDNDTYSLEDTEAAAADFLGAAFELDPHLAHGPCTDPTQARFMAALLENEDYQALHRTTALDPLASELAAGHFAQGFQKLKDEEAPEDHDEAPEAEPGDGAGFGKKEIAALKAAAGATDNAAKDVGDLREMQRGLGGDGPNPGENVPLAEMRRRFDTLRKSRTLRRIMALAGRYRRAAQSAQRRKTTHGRDDMVGVELAGDLARIVPSELASLDDEDLQWPTLRRLLENSLLCREYRGVEPVGAGPIVVIVDESGSMGEEPIETAKAFCLAMAWVARHQKRWILLYGFSGGCETPGNILKLEPGKWNQDALIDWLEHFYSGGSDRDVPTAELPEAWDSLGCPRGKTDVIQITDAHAKIPAGMRDRFNAWKAENQVKYYTLAIGTSDAGDLAHVSDRLWCIPDLDLDQDPIQELLNI